MLKNGVWRLALAMIASIALSVGGVVFAVRCGVAADGQRGGGLAVALTFFILFLGRGTAEAALGEPNPDADSRSLTPDAQLLADIQFELKRLRNSLASMFDWSRHEKLYLLIASVIGTFFWTFGDLIAKAFGAAG
jgi:hypothetical protein